MLTTLHQPAIQTTLNYPGYKCWHSTLSFGDNIQCRRLVEAIENENLHDSATCRKDFDRIFSGYDAVSADPPAFAFVQEIVAAYPDAKIILIERDEDAWYESSAATVQYAAHRRELNFIADIDPTFIGPVSDIRRAFGCTCGGRSGLKLRCAVRPGRQRTRDGQRHYYNQQQYAAVIEYLTSEAATPASLRVER